jgi:hypothetical protein
MSASAQWPSFYFASLNRHLCEVKRSLVIHFGKLRHVDDSDQWPLLSGLVAAFSPMLSIISGIIQFA